MTRQEFAEVIALLTGAIGKPMPDEQVAAWYALLSDLTAEQLRRGIIETLRTHQYAGFPPVGSVVANAAGDASHRAILAWQAVADSLREFRHLVAPSFSDPVVMATIHSMGGWLELARSDTEQLWKRKHFCDTYAALSRLRDLPADLTRPLGNWNNKGHFHERYDTEGRLLIPHVRCLSVDPPDADAVVWRVLDEPKSLPESGNNGSAKLVLDTTDRLRTPESEESIGIE